MIKISKVEVQKKHDNRVSIFVDDEYYASMLLDTAVKYGIKKDLEMDEDALNKYIVESENQSALNKAMNYINTAFKTAKQIREYLNKKGYEKKTVDYVVDKLKEYDYINDKKYAELFIQYNRNKYGINLLKTKLFEKGISKIVVDEVFLEYEPSDDEIYNLLIKKIGKKTISNDLLTKSIRFLSARGFKYEDIKKAVNRLKENHEVIDDESWD